MWSEVNQRLLRLAHRYLKNGDLWAFVEAVDADYRRYERDADEAKRREDVDAATFVEKVLQQRDQDHVKAWRSFMEATKSKYVDESHRDDGSTSLIPGPRLRLLLDGLGSEVTPEQEAARSRRHGARRGRSEAPERNLRDLRPAWRAGVAGSGYAGEGVAGTTNA